MAENNNTSGQRVERGGEAPSFESLRMVMNGEVREFRLGDISIDLQLMQDWHDARDAHDDSKKDELRSGYNAEIERIYQEFLHLRGEVSAETINRYVVSLTNFRSTFPDSQLKKKIPWGSDYDIGYRFTIDALTNGQTSISPEEQNYFRQQLLAMCPAYNDRSGFATPQFAEDYPNKENFISALEYWRGRALRLWAVGELPHRIMFAGLLHGDKADPYIYINGQKVTPDDLSSLPVEYQALYHSPHTDTTRECEMIANHLLDIQMDRESPEHLDEQLQAPYRARDNFAQEFAQEYGLTLTEGQSEME